MILLKNGADLKYINKCIPTV